MIDDNYKEQFELLKFSYFKENKKIDRKINIKDGRIFYQNKNWHITIIEIKEKDDLDLCSFLEIDNSKEIKNPKLKNIKVYLLHYPQGQEDFYLSQGILDNISDNNKYYLGNYASEPGSSGCPVIDYETNLVIGIHRGIYKENHLKGCIILISAINEFINEKREEIEKAINSNPFPYSDTMDLIYLFKDNKLNKFFSKQFIDRYKLKKECK